MRKKQVIVTSVAAQDGNLGDLEIRRILMAEVAKLDIPIIGYKGQMSDGYMQQFIEHTKSSWHRSSLALQYQIVKHYLLGYRINILMMPGPIRLHGTPKLYAKHILNLCNIVIANLSGGSTQFIGKAYRGNSAAIRKLIQKQEKYASTFIVRDELSREMVGGKCKVCPDLAFFGADASHANCAEKPLVAISLREVPERDIPNLGELILAIHRLNLTPIIVSQVKDDTQHAQLLAHTHSCNAMLWTNQPHAAYMKMVQQLYKKSAAIISNRLHALIFGATAGAAPIPILSHNDKKLIYTLQPVLPNIRGIEIAQFENISADEWRTHIENALAEQNDMRSYIASAKHTLDQEFSMIRDTILNK